MIDFIEITTSWDQNNSYHTIYRLTAMVAPARRCSQFSDVAN